MKVFLENLNLLLFATAVCKWNVDDNSSFEAKESVFFR